MKFLLICLSFFYTLLYAYEKSSDTKNVYYTSTHFRAIAGSLHVDSFAVEQKATSMLDAAEKSWLDLVDSFDFLSPKISQTGKVDIYIGNYLAYNDEYDMIETIPSFYAGLTKTYASSDTYYFVLNPNMDENKTKVTIAHEFFHTIQQAYFDQTLIDDVKWRKNIWWLEATAVLMEDEVYDKLDEYLSYISNFFTSSYKSIETYDGVHEYSTVAYAKYFREKYGIELIKETFKRIETSGDDGYFEILDEILQEWYGSSMKEELKEFSRWVYSPSLYFEEGANYPTLSRYFLNSYTSLEKGGILALKDLTSYTVLSNEFYSQIFSDENNQNIFANDKDVLVSNYSSTSIGYDELYLNVNDSNDVISIDGKVILLPFLNLNYDASSNTYSVISNGISVNVDTNYTTIADISFPNSALITQIDTNSSTKKHLHVKIKTRSKLEL